MTDQTEEPCPDDLLSDVVARLETDEVEGLRRLDALAERHPTDPRLPFLLGSILAGARRYDEAQVAMHRAVHIAPDYAVARFQLGFLHFTSGDAVAAEAVWAPLAARQANDPFRLFAAGLARLAVDDFEGAAHALQDGMANNADLPQLNRDMQLIIDGMPAPSGNADQAPMSGAQLLLMQDAAKPTRH